MSIQKKSLISTLKTAKKANVASSARNRREGRQGLSMRHHSSQENGQQPDGQQQTGQRQELKCLSTLQARSVSSTSRHLANNFSPSPDC